MGKEVFISYKSEEYEIARRVKVLIESNGVSCWMAPESIPPSSNYATEIDGAIRDCSVFVLILSEEAQKSEWIPKELDRAINYLKPIIPFHIDLSKLVAPYSFYLTNVQRLEAFNDLDSACSELLRRIGSLTGRLSPADENKQTGQVMPVLKDDKKQTENISCLISFYSDGGTIFFYSPESASKEEHCFFDFNEERWKELSGMIVRLCSTVLGIDEDDISIELKKKLGLIGCAPVDRYRYVDEPFRLDFDATFLFDEKPENFDRFHFSLEKNTFEISFSKNDKEFFPENCGIEDIVSDGEKFFDTVRSLIALCNPNVKTVCGKKFIKDSNSNGYCSFELTFLKK